MQNEKKKSEIACGLLWVFFGLLNGLLACWIIGLLFRVLERKKKKKKEEKEEGEEEGEAEKERDC